MLIASLARALAAGATSVATFASIMPHAWFYTPAAGSVDELPFDSKESTVSMPVR